MFHFQLLVNLYVAGFTVVKCRYHLYSAHSIVKNSPKCSAIHVIT